MRGSININKLIKNLFKTLYQIVITKLLNQGSIPKFLLQRPTTSMHPVCSELEKINWC